MSLKILEHPVTGQQYAMGRKRSSAPPHSVKLAKYINKSTAITPPESFDYATQARGALARVYLNDRLGCCAIAGAGHIEGVWRANASSGADQFIVSNKDIEGAYSVAGHYVPGDPKTDNGCELPDVLRIWQKSGLWGHRIYGWVSVNPSDPAEVALAQYLFESLYFGIELPDAWVNPFPSGPGFIWDAAGPADPDNGHCFIGTGRVKGATCVNSWGLNGAMTDAALAHYGAAASGGEVYAILSRNAIARLTQKSPAGFDFDQLVSDLLDLQSAA